MFGDSEYVVNSSKNLYSKLTKHHNALSYHGVREAIASGYVKFTFIPGKKNPADILSKYWSYSNVKDLLLTAFHYQGDPLGRCHLDTENSQTSTWTRIDPKAKVFYTTKQDGPNWKDMYRSVTIDTSN